MTPMEQQNAVNTTYFHNHHTKKDSRVRLLRSMFDFYATPVGTKTIDIGCGDGEIMAPFTRDFHIQGVECFNPLALAAIKNGYRTVFSIDLNKDWLVEQQYDFVVSGETSEHLVDTDHFLTEVNRILKPGGLFFYTFPNIRTPIGIAMMLLQNRPPMSSARYRSPHFKDFTTSTARLALGNCGFEVLEMAGTSFGPPGVDFLTPIARWLPSWSTQVVCVCQKVREVAYKDLQVGNFEIYR